VCENPTRGRSWFFTSVGLEVFHVKILCPLFLSAEFSLPDVLRTACPNRAYSVFARKFEKFSKHNSLPLLCLVFLFLA